MPRHTARTNAILGTMFKPVVILLWVIAGVGTLAAIVPLIFFGFSLPIEISIWIVWTLILGFLNFRMCYKWLGREPNYPALGYYVLNSALILVPLLLI